jgi:uncharacterized protein (DUF1499 family)
MPKLTAIAAHLIFKISVSLCGLFLIFVSAIAPATASPLSHHLNSAIATPMAIFAFSGTRPSNLGVINGKLQPCPNSPNCVSSQSADAEHGIAPLTFVGDPAAAIANLQKIVLAMPRTKVITSEGNYLYAEFTSALMGYVDDVEFFANPDKGIIEVRSASRVGESDLGVNRQRIEAIRANFA